jgi:hypothetical protein
MFKIVKNYSHILIIGNGFDLNLKLKTSYTDFIKSEHFKQLQINGNYLAEHLQKKHDLQNWIDIEIELKKYSLAHDIPGEIDTYEKDFYSLCNSLKDYLAELDYSKLDIKSHSYKLLTQIFDKDFLILDFNYTNSVKIILEQLGLKQIEIDERLIKVHGSIDEKQIIFGVEDHARIKPEHVFLRKAFNRDFKGVNMNILLYNLTELFIFGHSLGETDHMYFIRFFQNYSTEHYHDKGKKIHFYYFGNQGYKQLFIQLDTLTNNGLTIFKQNNDFITIDSST